MKKLFAALVTGVARMDSVHALAAGGASEQPGVQAENLRKMLLAMVEDIRVVLIKLAERTQALRHLMGGGDADRMAAAREVMDVYAPLANRLGLWQLKWELEDLSLRALEPAAAFDLPVSGTEGIAQSGPLEAIKIYERLLTEYPNYERRDQVLYQMARAYDELGRTEDAMKTMEQVIAAARAANAHEFISRLPSGPRLPIRSNPSSPGIAAEST